MTKCKIVRESGIELLRLLAATSIVYGHFLNDGDWHSDGLQSLIYWFLRIPGISGVDLFMLIMGFFMCTSSKRTLGKPLNLVFQMVFYSVCLYLIFVVAGLREFSLSKLAHRFVVGSWFVTLYVVIYFISPYINIILNKLSFREWKWFLFFYFLFFSIWPMLLAILEHFGCYLDAWSTIGKGGNNAGFNIITYFLMYCIGAFIRLQKIYEKVDARTAWISIIMIWIVSMAIKIIPIHSTPWHLIGFYDNIFVVSFATFSFIAFKHMDFKSKIINNIAKAAFAIYLVHPIFFKVISTKDILQLPLWQSLPYMLAFIIFVSIVAWSLFYLYNIILEKDVSKLDKYEIPYFDTDKK